MICEEMEELAKPVNVIRGTILVRQHRSHRHLSVG